MFQAFVNSWKTDVREALAGIFKFNVLGNKIDIFITNEENNG